jgi:methenyltetrahydromethanopterin cyclohydrolase
MGNSHYLTISLTTSTVGGVRVVRFVELVCFRTRELIFQIEFVIGWMGVTNNGDVTPSCLSKICCILGSSLLNITERSA